MSSPLYTFPSDFSTPKPYFYVPHEDSASDEFIRHLASLQNDINALGKEIENLRTENLMLKAKNDLVEKEKEKHVLQHAKEKFELEKSLRKEKKMREKAENELLDFKEKFQVFTIRSQDKNSSGVSSEKSFKIKKVQPNASNFKSKLVKMEKEHKILKKKIKDIEIGTLIGMNKSSVLRWDERY